MKRYYFADKRKIDDRGRSRRMRKTFEFTIVQHIIPGVVGVLIYLNNSAWNWYSERKRIILGRRQNRFATLSLNLTGQSWG